MHHCQSVYSGRDVVEHDPGALWQSFQLPHRRRLDDIEGSEKYKARRRDLPCERNGDQRDELAGNFVDHDECGIFAGRGPGNVGGGGYADQDDDGREGDAAGSAQGRGECRRQQPHRSTVAAEPQVPGPGRRRPMPKKVAIRRGPERCAARRPGSRARVAGRLTVRCLGVFRVFVVLNQLLQRPLPGEEITYSPLAHFPRSIRRQRSLQKGKSGSVACHRFLADRALQFDALRGMGLHCAIRLTLIRRSLPPDRSRGLQ